MAFDFENSRLGFAVEEARIGFMSIYMYDILYIIHHHDYRVILNAFGVCRRLPATHWSLLVTRRCNMTREERP